MKEHVLRLRREVGTGMAISHKFIRSAGVLFAFPSGQIEDSGVEE